MPELREVRDGVVSNIRKLLFQVLILGRKSGSVARVHIIMGVSGSGKTTIGKSLSEKLGLPFYDGDDFHPPANKTKMKAGIPLSDEDRQEWLGAMNRLILEQSRQEGAVIACSALKEKYRLALSKQLESPLSWIVLRGDFELIHDRMMARKDHFMPAGLLQSQFEAMEYPAYGMHLSIEAGPEKLVDAILDYLEKPEFGLVGLGVMGKSLARNLASKGVRMALFNQYVPGKEEKVAEKAIAAFPELASSRGFEDLHAFADSLSRPRNIFLMVPAGPPVDAVIQQLLPSLSPGDILMDGGNSHFEDTDRRISMLSSYDIHYLGIGVSGGEKGALTGPSIMPGGSREAWEKLSPYLSAAAARDKHGQACCTYIGPGGSGHFVKMIHNGIEYAEMQLLAEAYWILREGMQYSPERIADLFDRWNQGDAAGYLLEITIKILRFKQDGRLVLDEIADIGGSKGTGSWSLNAAAQLGVPANLIGEALFARYLSSFKEARTEAAKQGGTVSAPVQVSEDQLHEAYQLARWINHHQGLEVLKAASNQYGWDLKLPELTRIWTNGCIIRSSLMETLSRALMGAGQALPAHLFLVRDHRTALKEVVVMALKAKLAIPCLSASLNYLLGLSSADSPANLIQAQRDFFGAHTYRKKEDPFGKAYHTEWE